MCLCSILCSSDLCSVGWLIEALIESVWKRNHKCRPVSFRSDVPQINGLEIHTKCRSHQSELACVEQKWTLECVCVFEDSLWSLWTLLRSPRRFEPNVSKANETHYTVYEFRKGETIEILSRKLGRGVRGFTRYRAEAINMRRERLVCVYVVFFAPQSQIRRTRGPLEESGHHWNS